MKHILLSAVAILGFGLSFATTSVAAPAPPPNPAATKKLSPEMAEYFNLCSPGGGPGLKDSVVNPTCKAHRLPETFDQPPSLKGIYSGLSPKECLVGANGAFRCLYRFPKTACNKYVEAHNQLNDLPASQPWKKATAIKNSQGGHQCFYCWKNESTSETAADGQQYCPNGGFDISSEIVDEGSYSYFCNETVANGPYSNFPDTYEVCGGTETTAHKGMEFALSQKSLIKEINQEGNGLPVGGNQLKSDLAGFCYPKPPSGCPAGGDYNATTCKEPEFLTTTPYQKHSVNVHHIVPKKDGTSCPCGKNSMKNAALISQSLNTFFSNKDLTQLQSSCGTMKSEVESLNMPYNMLTETIVRLNKRPKYSLSILKKLKARRGK